MSLQNWDLDEENLPETENSKITPLKKKKKHTNPKEESIAQESVSASITEKENAGDSTVKKKKRKLKEKTESMNGSVTEKKNAVDACGKKKKRDIELSPGKGTATQKSHKKKINPTTEDTLIGNSIKIGKKFRKSTEAKFSVSSDPTEESVVASEVNKDVSTTDEQDSEKPKKPKLSALKRKSLKHKERKRKEKLNRLRSTMPREKFEEYLSSGTSGENPQVAALNYLKLWKDFRSTWKFSKVRQTWLLRHWSNTEILDDERFAVLLEYMSALKGQARETTSKEASELLEKHKDASEANSKVVIRRATQILQMLD
ncbi:uncharacterized protein C7orf50 homolog [Watersipora subatra]|uniref:uncharacterized protein C7orf50 homolog n=1 Tax=Watersipora subatra TaxID=2589382 RepID=UPI00355B25F9